LGFLASVMIESSGLRFRDIFEASTREINGELRCRTIKDTKDLMELERWASRQLGKGGVVSELAFRRTE
jgi:hypothetical protein